MEESICFIHLFFILCQWMFLYSIKKGFQRNVFLSLVYFFLKHSYFSVLCSIDCFIHFKPQVLWITMTLKCLKWPHVLHPWDPHHCGVFMFYTFVLIDKLLAITRLGSPSWMAGLQERDKRMPREHWHRSRFHIGPNCANTNIEREKKRARESQYHGQ